MVSGAEQLFLRTRLQWLMTIRLAVITISLMAGVGLLNITFGTFYYYIYFYYTISLLYIVFIQRTRHYVFFGVFQIAIDLLAITSIVLENDPVRDVYSNLYVLAIILSTFVFPRHGGWITAVVASVLYVGSVLYFFRREPASFGGLAPDYAFYVTYMYVTVFCGVGYLSNYLGKLLREKTEELRHLELQSSYVFSRIATGMLMTTDEGRITYANPAAERILACAAGGLAGLDWRQALGVDRIESAERRDALLKGQEAELVAVNRNGEECPLAVTFAPIEQPHGRARFNIVLFRDLRDQRAGERTMRDAERLHAIVDLSSTIAHEIRNPLASMSGSAELLQDKVVDEDSKHLAGIIVREVERLDAIVEDFLSFTRLRTMEIGSVDVNELMMDVVVMLYRSGKFNPNIKLVCRELPEPLVIKGDGKQLRQALLNIGMNALDAMPDGGELEVAATRATRDGMVEVFIRDTGRGMPAAIQSRVFQPFFSTKDHGSGIGLFVAQNVIQGHRGEISFETADGAGTTFHILLPVT
ncbi:PAS domain-containing protein [bacterium]|nr:PAS domain-containing protein [bacterium]